jgi:hypothetical protein
MREGGGGGTERERQSIQHCKVWSEVIFYKYVLCYLAYSLSLFNLPAYRYCVETRAGIRHTCTPGTSIILSPGQDNNLEPLKTYSLDFFGLGQEW